jgi:signal transduction histidine kinase
MYPFSQSRPLAYFVATAATVAALLVRVVIAPGLFTNATFLPFFMAVLLAAWYGGLGPGLLATALGALAYDWLLLEPVDSLAIGTVDGQVRMGLSLLLSIMISAACESLHAARRRAASMRSDITELRRMEEELRELAAELSEADHRKDRFLATLSHELRNPLAPIRNALELIKRASGDPDKIEFARAAMERQVTQMVRLVDDLLDVSRITRDKLQLRREVVALREVVDAAMETAAPLVAARGHVVELDMAEEPLHVDVDPARAAQVLSNLLNNAAKYTNRGGRLRVHARREGDEAVISVIDNGIGVSEADIPRALEMFGQVDHSLTRTEGGLGIGLSLAKRLVEMHGGRIVIRNAPDGPGTEVEVRLPAAGLPVVGPDASPRSALRPLRVLVADDNVDSADTLAQVLELMGHEVRVANDGEDAVEMASPFAPELVMLDIGMPGLNGYEACRRIRALPWAGDRVRIVAVTGWGQQDDRQRSRDAGFDLHLVKPLDPEAVERMLAEMFPAG